ncbi:MAG: DUF815 domain-containing protein, partial [Porphyrobacter sp.]|nr:DUF815 domain-containing protein [Porphyrobacter sp.]
MERHDADPARPILARIAAALERLAPPPPPAPDWLAHPAYVWTGAATRAVPRIDAPPLALLRGIEAQKQAVTTNVLHHARGHAAHDMLLWGARGMGKSALLRAAVAAAQDEEPGRLALVQVGSDAVPRIADELGRQRRQQRYSIEELEQEHVIMRN